MMHRELGDNLELQRTPCLLAVHALQVLLAPACSGAFPSLIAVCLPHNTQLLATLQPCPCSTHACLLPAWEI